MQQCTAKLEIFNQVQDVELSYRMATGIEGPRKTGGAGGREKECPPIPVEAGPHAKLLAPIPT